MKRRGRSHAVFALGQRFTAEYREDIKFAVIRDAVHLLEGLHIRFGDHKIESGIAGHVGQDWRL